MTIRAAGYAVQVTANDAGITARLTQWGENVVLLITGCIRADVKNWGFQVFVHPVDPATTEYRPAYICGVLLRNSQPWTGTELVNDMVFHEMETQKYAPSLPASTALTVTAHVLLHRRMTPLMNALAVRTRNEFLQQLAVNELTCK